jgi:hypothetical protein
MRDVDRGCVRQTRSNLKRRDCLADAGQHGRSANDRRVWGGTETLTMCIDARQHRDAARIGFGTVNPAALPLGADLKRGSWRLPGRSTATGA